MPLKKRLLKVLGCLTLVGLLLVSLPVHSQPKPSSVAVGRGGAVASIDVRATQIGIDILRQGGNAIDAAVATAAALGVVEPFSAGIGGGGFMTIYLKQRDRVMTLDGREEAPAAVTSDLFRDPDSAKGEPLPFDVRSSSGLAVGVPGTPLTWAEALNRYGTLSLPEVLQPAIALAEKGFPVEPVFAQEITQNQNRFVAFTSTQALFLPQGNPPEVGSTFRNPDLAKTYRLLAAQGINAFYRGEIAEAIVNTVQTPPTVPTPTFKVWPGEMTLTDLDQYEVRVRPPVATEYRGYRFYGIGLPSSGGLTVAQTLELLEPSDLAGLNCPEALHRLIEAERLAFADRNAYLGDPEYVDVPVAGLFNAEYVDRRSQEIFEDKPERDAQFRPAAGNPLPFQVDPSPSRTEFLPVGQANSDEGTSTAHLTVVDAIGNIVSYTLSIERTGGSGIVVPGYGFLLNNELTDFDPVAPHPNSPEPGKRPRSSMAPTIAFAPDGSVLAWGSPGGSTIISTVLEIAVNVIDFGMGLADAIAAPRFSQRNLGSTTVEPTFATSDLAAELTKLGHDFEITPEIGAANGILVKPSGELTAATELSRRGGGSAMTLR